MFTVQDEMINRYRDHGSGKMLDPRTGCSEVNSSFANQAYYAGYDKDVDTKRQQPIFDRVYYSQMPAKLGGTNTKTNQLDRSFDRQLLGTKMADDEACCNALSKSAKTKLKKIQHVGRNVADAYLCCDDLAGSSRSSSSSGQFPAHSRLEPETHDPDSALASTKSNSPSKSHPASKRRSNNGVKAGKHKTTASPTETVII